MKVAPGKASAASASRITGARSSFPAASFPVRVKRHMTGLTGNL